MAKTQVNLTEEVQGTLPVGNGGTGNTAGLAATATALATARNISGVAFDGSANITVTRAGVPETVTVSAAASLTLTTTSSCYVFTGSSATTWTLPAVSGNTGVFLKLENRGSAAITLVRAGTDNIWFLSALTAMTIAAGGSLQLVDDGTYWSALSNDLTNNSVGILPAANGGTGQSSLTSLTLTTPTVSGYTETVTTTTVTTTYTVNLASSTVFVITLTASTACTFTMPTAVAGKSFVLILKQPSTTGAATATFTSVKWPAAGAPTITATAGKNDILTFISDGTDWYGSYSQGYTY